MLFIDTDMEWILKAIFIGSQNKSQHKYNNYVIQFRTNCLVTKFLTSGVDVSAQISD